MKQEETKPNHPTPTEPGFYQTGNTGPKKSHRGLLAALIMIVIFFGGIISVLGILNVQLFRKVMELSPESYAFRFSRDNSKVETAPEPTGLSTAQEFPENTLQIQLNQAPPAVDNIPQEGGLSLQDIYNQNISSVVSISSIGGSGSGMVISECGYILTNCHVLGGAKSAQVLFHDGTTHTARMVGADATSDLAVLDVDTDGLTPVTFGSDALVQVGDPVVAIGDPLGVTLRGTMTNGIVSAINRNLLVNGRNMTLIQTNAALNAGNSGGPLLNCYGQVIGINTMKIGDYASTSGVEGLGFAIPSSTVKEVVDQLLRQGYVPGRPALGFTVERVSAFDQLYYRVPAGLFITSVTGSAPTQPGDILLSFAGYRVGDTETLETYLNQHQAGDTVAITVYRDGKRLDLTLTLEEAN